MATTSEPSSKAQKSLELPMHADTEKTLFAAIGGARKNYLQAGGRLDYTQ